MTIQFEKSNEAFLSVLALVLGADDVGSLEERDFLFEKVKSLSLFGNPTAAEFGKLLAKATDNVYSQLPLQDGAPTQAGVSALLADVKKALNQEQQRALLKIANELSISDGTSNKETALLAEIRRVFK